MEEKSNVIKPEEKKFHILGFNRTIVKKLIDGTLLEGIRPILVKEFRETTTNYGGKKLSDKTVKRWQKGEDIYLSVLLNVCDELRLDPLRWICIDGKPLKSTLEDLYRLEQSGTDCATLLRERGIEPVVECENRPRTEDQWAEVLEKRKEMIEECQRFGREYERNKKARNVSALPNNDIIQQVAQIQREAFEQANHNTAAIRHEYQELLNDSNIKLGAANNEIERLREALRSANEQLEQVRAELAQLKK